MNHSQRWKERRHSFRERGDAFHPSEYGVDLVDLDREAKAFVERHHYSGSYPAARLRVGLYRARPGWYRSELVGVLVFSVPMQAMTIPAYLPTCTAAQGVELGRLVLLDEVPFNAESWFCSRAFRLLRSALPEVRGILSYSDPFQRTTHDGRVVMPGHVGTVYQALGARYVGTSAPRWHYLNRDGRFLSQRALSKIRNHERGHESAQRDLVSLGAPGRLPGEEPSAWLTRVLPSFTRVRHPGNHTYLWCLDPVAWTGVREAQPYPKKNLSTVKESLTPQTETT